MNPKPARYLCAFFMILFGYFGISHAQDFHLKNYSTEDGLSNRFIYTINQDQSGYLWIGTGSGLNRFDGFEFQTDFLPDSLSESFFYCSMKDSLGSLWFGSNNGLVIQYNGHDFTNYNLKEYTTGAITGLIEGQDETIIVSTQNGTIIKIDPINPNNTIYCGVASSIPQNYDGNNAAGVNCPVSNDCCAIKPSVKIKDNWGWCNNGTNVNPFCPSGGYEPFDGWVFIMEKR